MARRPVFVPDSDKPYVSELSLDFEYFPGFSIQNKQRSMHSPISSITLSGRSTVRQDQWPKWWVLLGRGFWKMPCSHLKRFWNSAIIRFSLTCHFD